MVELRGISKYFPSNGIMALENSWFSLKAGEVHALLGENGTGKSTLMHILAGYLPPSSGSILVDGKEKRFSTPADALAIGIGMVRQHPGFIRGFKVWEDCILGAETQNRRSPLRDLFLDPGKSRRRVEELSNRWNFDLPLDGKAESLTVSQRQKAAVLALLLRDIRYFIFDEPTAVLTPEETESFIELMDLLRSEGRGIVFITHKLDEALAVSDRVTVIRRGVTGEAGNTKEITAENLNEQIFGARDIPAAKINMLPRQEAAPEEESHVLVIKDLTIASPGLPVVRNINLKLNAGQIMGIAGVRDGGLETLELAVTGLLDQTNQNQCRLKGSITLNGHDITCRGIRVFRNAGGAYLGADRLGNNLARSLPLLESLVIHAFRRARRGFGFFLNMAYLNSWGWKIMNRAGITRPVSDKASSFSGGMLQRILLAREFAEDASLLVLAEPGSALDKSNRSWLAEQLASHKKRGAAALVFSADAAELLSVADEIMVLKNGVLAAADEALRGENEI